MGYILNFFDSIFGAAFGTIIRPLKHILLTLSLYTLLTLTLPIKIFNFMYELSSFDLYARRKGSYIAASLGTLFVAPMALGVTTILGVTAVLGSVVLSPLLGFANGLVNGVKGAFKATWLSKGLFEFTKDLFTGLIPVRAPANQVRVNYEPVRQVIIQQPPRQLANIAGNNQNALNNDQELDDALRISFEYHRDQNSIASVARRAANLYRAPNDALNYNASLHMNLSSLTAIPQQKLNFLTEAELEKLKDIKEENVEAALKSYNDMMEDRTCIYSLSTLNEMKDPITVEVKLNDSGRLHIYAIERSCLLDHINSRALDRIVPEITQLRPQTYANLAPTQDNKLSGNNNTSQVTIYRGIDPVAHQTIKSASETLRTTLQKLQSVNSVQNILQALPRVNNTSLKAGAKPPAQPKLSPRSIQRNKMFEAAIKRLLASQQQNDFTPKNK